MQAVLPKLNDIVNENNGTNIVEIFLCPSYFKSTENTYAIDVGWDKPQEFFHLENPQEEIQYHHRDMCYVFDTKNDAQKSFRRIVRNEMFYKNLYILALQEESVPSHCFPSTHDINAVIKTTKYSQKINNRMHWIYEKDEKKNCWISYIRYQHAPNVEMTKMQLDLEKTLQRVPKPKS